MNPTQQQSYELPAEAFWGHKLLAKYPDFEIDIPNFGVYRLEECGPQLCGWVDEESAADFDSVLP